LLGPQKAHRDLVQRGYLDEFILDLEENQDVGDTLGVAID